MRLKSLAVGVLLVAWIQTGASLVFGWGGEGHAIIASIATTRLSDDAKAQVADLLGDQKLTDIASWADQVRNERSETGPWHYVDIPVDAAAFDERRDGQNGNNVIDKVNYFAGILADKSKPKNDRIEALKFVVHFVGDMHQPLHCADRSDKDGKSDKGGNGVLVYLLDQPRAMNLHSVWDSGILHLSMGNTPTLVYASALNARISAAQAKEWASGTPLDWANESHKLAVECAYAGVPIPAPGVSPTKLKQDYVDANEKVIDTQLERGGVRLAMVLNKALGSDPATKP